jgi:hypothetical protein
MTLDAGDTVRTPPTLEVMTDRGDGGERLGYQEVAGGLPEGLRTWHQLLFLGPIIHISG